MCGFGVSKSLVKYPQESVVPFVVEQWDLKGEKEVVYNERRAGTESSCEATHQSPGGCVKKRLS